jgi:hypothetical protein
LSDMRFTQRPATVHGRRAAPVELLNVRWPKSRIVECCAACGEHLRVDGHAVRQAGEAFHAACASPRPPRPIGKPGRAL